MFANVIIIHDRYHEKVLVSVVWLVALSLTKRFELRHCLSTLSFLCWNNLSFFYASRFSKNAWFSSPLGGHAPSNLDLNDWFFYWLTCKHKLGSHLFCITLSKFWYAKNQCLFKQQQSTLRWLRLLWSFFYNLTKSNLAGKGRASRQCNQTWRLGTQDTISSRLMLVGSPVAQLL